MKLLQRMPRLPRLAHLAGGCSPIGVDLGSRQVKLLQLARHGAGWRIMAAASFPRASMGKPFDSAEANRLAEVIDRQGFTGRKLVAGLPAGKLMTSALELPPRAPGVPLEQIARMELARVHQRDAGSFEFAQWEVPPPARASKATHVMTASCPHAIADSLLDALEPLDLTVRALDAEPCALARACRTLLADSPATTALLDLGWSASRLAVLHRGVIVYSRVIDQARLELLYLNLQQELEIDEQTIGHLLAENYFVGGGAAAASSDGCDSAGDEARAIITAHFDALVREINVALSYATHQYPESPLSRLLLVGGGAELAGVAEHLGAILGVAARAVQPAMLLDGTDIDSGSGAQLCTSASMVAALGLALYGEGEQ